MQELLVTVAIIALLLWLLLPAIQKSREAARRAGCQSNMRQIGMGLESYLSTYRVLAPGMTYNKGYSFLVAILPYVGEQNLANQVDHNVLPDFSKLLPSRVALYSCPSDPEAATGGVGKSNYCGNYSSGSPGFSQAFDGYFQGHREVWVYDLQGGPLKASSIVDGTSRTVAVSEWRVGSGQMSDFLRVNWNLPSGTPATHGTIELLRDHCRVDPPVYSLAANGQPSPYFAGSWNERGLWLDGNPSITLYNHSIVPGNNSCYWSRPFYGVYSPTSFHPGGANALFADGHVQFIANSIDQAVWTALGSRNGHEVVSEF